ncbi:MAG: hypothetical protein JRD87_15020, partial [Deltaproteobacteria bacterium]|nr:hypothetical protein [Deltaproteobacteria bacterium]
NPREKLLPGDLLRLGYEDESWHTTTKVGKYVPKGGRLYLKLRSKKRLEKGIPVFLIDRQEKDFKEILAELESERAKAPVPKSTVSNFVARQPGRYGKNKGAASDLHVYRQLGKTRHRGLSGLWLSTPAIKKLPKELCSRLWWWLPPVVWPDDTQNQKEQVTFLQYRQCTGIKNSGITGF